MTGDGSLGDVDDRRSHVREKARVLRERQRKRDLLRRVLLGGAIGIGLIAVIVAVVVTVTSSIRPESSGPRNMASDGIVIGAHLNAKVTPALDAGAAPVPVTRAPNVAHIRVYVDYLCPWCGEFEETNGEQLKSWLTSGAAVLEVHPIAVLTSKSKGTEYSLRAANAAACVANYSPDAFFAFNRMLFEKQPEEGTSGLSDSTLASYATSVGASAAVEDCIEEGRFTGWVQSATQRAVNGPLPGTEVERVEATPTILVNGRQYTGALDDAEEFTSFVIGTTSETSSSATPTPSAAGGE